MTYAVKDAVTDLLDDQGFRLAAALSYYAVLSLAPFLLVMLELVGWIIGREAVSTELVNQMRNLVGEAGADITLAIIQHAGETEQRGIASIVGTAVLLIGASGILVQLRDAMNTIWEVKARSRAGFWGLLRARLVSFGMVLVVGFLMLVSLALSAFLAAARNYSAGRFPGTELLLGSLHWAATLALFTTLFAALFRYLPDVAISWRDVWIGALTTAALFSVGKFVIGLYLGHSSIGTAYGASGSIVVLLVWVYYSSVILLFGAELAQVIARHSGSGIRTSK
ncbi:MAG TPA: YihY/virulence factor BrkB family protein [Phycisphaerae bacterium]|nr:YihY/virulence factor BrkB family protein [Phycisphaerae bacterium]